MLGIQGTLNYFSMFLIVVCWIMDEVLDVWTDYDDDDDDVIRLVSGLDDDGMYDGL